MARTDCDDCKGTGEIEVESVDVDRPHYSKEHKGFVHEITGKGDWSVMQCPCVGEEND